MKVANCIIFLSFVDIFKQGFFKNSLGNSLGKEGFKISGLPAQINDAYALLISIMSYLQARSNKKIMRRQCISIRVIV